MAVLSYREVLPRTLSHKFGEAPAAERKYVCTLDEATGTQEIINTVGILHGSIHPEFSYLLCMNVAVNETDAFHAEVTYSYETVKDREPNPLARKDVWSFSVSSAAVPALFYYHGESGNSDIRPLVNAAGDFIEGLQAVEGEVKATINGNRAAFPLAIAASVTNSINSAPYLGGAAYTWLCQGISAQQQTEVVNGAEVNYWAVSVELVYRSSSWIMKLPHVGLHYIESGQKRRCWVYEGQPGSSEKVDASSPQALTSTGAMKYPGGEGVPEQLLRRVHQAIAFAQYFGTPPF